MPRRKLRWSQCILPFGLGGLMFQSGCAIDPDLLLQAGIQLFTELAIFISDSALVGLR